MRIPLGWDDTDQAVARSSAWRDLSWSRCSDAAWSVSRDEVERHPGTTLVLLVSLCASALGSSAATAAEPEATADAADSSTPTNAAEPRLAVPPPTGPLRVSTRRLHLVDRSRRDPWRPRPARAS